MVVNEKIVEAVVFKSGSSSHSFLFCSLYLEEKKYSNWQTIEQKIKQTTVMRANHDWNRLLSYLFIFFVKFITI